MMISNDLVGEGGVVEGGGGVDIESNGDGGGNCYDGGGEKCLYLH